MIAMRTRSTWLLTLGAFVGCARQPIEILAVAPRRSLGDNAVLLVDDPCSRVGALVAPVDVGRVKTWLLIDTGAYNHVLLPEVARQAGLTPRGEFVNVGRGDGLRAELVNARLTVPGLPVISQPVLTLELSAMAPCGQGGVLAPAQLSSLSSALVLDLPGKAMRLVPERAVGTTPASGFRAAFDGLLYVAEAQVDAVPARLLIDTGAARSWVFADSAVGQALMRHARPIDDGAVDIQGHQTTHRADAEITVGPMTWRTAIDIMPGHDPGGGDDGAIGIPELRTCVLTLHYDHLVGACT